MSQPAPPSVPGSALPGVRGGGPALPGVRGGVRGGGSALPSVRGGVRGGVRAGASRSRAVNQQNRRMTSEPVSTD